MPYYTYYSYYSYIHSLYYAFQHQLSPTRPAVGRKGSAAKLIGDTPYVTEAKAAQARCYIYCRQKISKSCLDDPYYRLQLEKAGALDVDKLKEVLADLDVPVSAKKLKRIAKKYATKSPVPIVVSGSVKLWVQAEFDLFKMFLCMAITKCQVECLGNPIGQAIHDCSTLADKHKYLAIGLQFILPGWDANMAVALSVVRCDKGTDKYLAAVIEKEIEKLTGTSFKELADSAIQDGAALGVARLLSVEAIVCLMHDNDKLGQSGMGGLVRSKVKKAVNPFPEGQALIEKLRTVAKHFSYAGRIKTLHACCKRTGAAAICPKIDKNTTRIMAVWRLLFSMLRLWKAVECYVREYNATKKTQEQLPVITLSEWQAVAEMEASLNITKAGCFLSQSESVYTGGYGFALKQLQIDTLRSDTLSVIHLNSITSSRQLMRTDVPVAHMTPIGKAAYKRTLAEGIRRWCPKNPTDDTDKFSVIMTKQDIVATMVDPRLCHGIHLSDKQVDDGASIFANTYAEYAMKAIRFATRMEGGSDDMKTEPTEKAPKKIYAETVKVQVKESGHLRRGRGFGRGADGKDASGPKVAPAKTFKYFKDQAETVHEAWREHSRNIQWEKYRPSLAQRAIEIAASEDGDNWRLVRDLMHVDLKQVLRDAKAMDPDMAKFGYIPYMAKTWLGRLLAESFAERMFSNANIVLTPGNMSLNPTEMGQLVVLRMNRRFMHYMKKTFKVEITTALGMDGTTCKADGEEEEGDKIEAGDLDPSDVTLVPVHFS